MFVNSYNNNHNFLKRKTVTAKQKYTTLFLTLILPEPKVIGHCSQYRAGPACTSVKTESILLAN